MGLEEHSFKYKNNGKEKTTCYLTAGSRDGPLLMFIHGWPAIGKVWKPQLEVFAGLGFRVVAPDMPGYGKSTADKDILDYTVENINLGMVALLEHLGRDKAIWIGHDWGCGAVWSFVAHYPEKCIAAAGLTVPYGVLELGLEEILKYGVNRDIYPADQYPFAQWDYQHFYETNFEDAHKYFDNNTAAVINLLYSKGSPEGYGKPALTSTVSKDGGWFGGQNLDPKIADRPLDQTVLDKETFKDLVEAMQRTGFFGADAWYANHERNRDYGLQKRKNGGDLHMPVLFIHAKFDGVCATDLTPRMCEPMRRHCSDLTEVTIDAGHWVAEEKPEEVSAAISRWLIESCKEVWPGYWSNPHVHNKI